MTREPGDVLPQPESVTPGGVRAWLTRPWVWLGLAILATLLHAALRILRTPRYFFWDDTQLGAYGQWYELGTRLLSGTWTILDPGAWQGGNLLAEGQWGVWSPLAWVVAIGAHAFGGATVYATLVKVGFLVLLCVGVFLLARDYGASPGWAAVAAFGATAGGQTMYLDAPSWVTGLQSVALFAVTWWTLRRSVIGGRNPLAFVISAYLLITVGYVFGVIELVILFVFVIIESAVSGGARAILRPVWLGVYAGLLTVFVYLPGILTAPVTVRSASGIENDQFLNMDLSDLATSPIVTAVSTVRGYWGDMAPVPLQYTSWLVPIALIAAAALWRNWRTLLPVFGVLIATGALVIGPSVLGPLRYPARMMPYLVLAVVLLIAVAATKGWPRRASRAQRVGVVLVIAGCAWFAWAAQPAAWAWVVGAAVLQIGAFAIMDAAVRRGADPRTGWGVPLIALTASVALMVPQLVKYGNSPLGEFRVPSSVSQMQAVGTDLTPGVMTVGDVYSLQQDPEAYDESLLANLWYLTEKDVVGVYTVLPFRAFAEELCIDIRGSTCPQAYERLFETTPAQPVALADDLRLNTVIGIPGVDLETAPFVPEGWTLQTGEHTWRVVRDEPVEPAGGIARVSAGVRAEIVSETDTELRLRVEDVTSTGGSVVFSRMAWPGYSASSGVIADPERGFLLTLDVSAEDRGHEITVTFRPPGWGIELASALLAAVLAVVLCAASFLSARRRPDAEAVPVTGTEPTGARD
ncbi:hypothetical protein [Microbacterium sp. NPDC056569]|uniref:hypothetical protein n=1 Tax=Microbacterium sp. NPDC056569 TaxID=3345867 RepID=UPI00366E14F1